MWVSILLDLGVNPNCVESGGGARDDALAVEETSAEEDGGSGSGSGWPADYFGLLHAARRREPCYEAIVASLLSAGADVNKQVAGKGYSAVYVAAQEGSTRILESLLAAGGDYTLRCHRGYVALHVAAQYGHADAVAALLRAVSFLALNSMTVYLTNIMII
jgi:cytohesin